MYNKPKTKIANNFPNNKKNNNPTNQKDNKLLDFINFKTQIPLFKMFMDNNNNKKIHLVKNSINFTKEDNIIKIKNNIIYSNPKMISFKILEAKYNMSPTLFSQKIIFDLIRNKRGHLLANYHEIILYDNSLKEFMKRKYRQKECLDKIPKYYNYYKNYLRYFCHPTFVDYFINKKMVKHMEKIAQIFYNKNYLGDIKTDNNEGINMIIFNKRVIREIEKVSIESNNNVTKETPTSTNTNINQNFINSEGTQISTLRNCPKITNNNANFDNNKNYKKEENCESILLNSKNNIFDINLENIQNKIETSNSLNILVNELKENTHDKNNNIKFEKEVIKKYIPNKEISIKEKNKEIKPPSNISNQTKKMNIKYNSEKIFLKSNNANKRMGSIDQNKNINEEKLHLENNKEKPFLMNKKMINNLNININQLIINNKIITNFQDKSRNKDYKNLNEKNKDNNQILKEIKEILKEDKLRKINIENMKINKNSKNKYKNIKDFKSTMKVYSSCSVKNFPHLNRINSMEKISPLSIRRKEINDKNSNIKIEKRKRNSSLLKLGGGILDNRGKITLLLKNSTNNRHIYKNFTKISGIRGKTGTSNDNNSTHKNYYIINSDKDIDKKRSISNSKNNQKKIFKSGFNFNLTNDKFNSDLSSPKNSLQNKDNNKKINNLKFNLHLKDINYNKKIVPFIIKKKIGQNILRRKEGNEEQILKLKNFDCIGTDKIKNLEIFTPRKNHFSKSPLSMKSN